MSNDTAALARSITRAGSRQSYLTARLLVDTDLVDDCCRAYGYFRWADDMVDDPGRRKDVTVAFIERQRALIECLYQKVRPDDLVPEEQIIADLIHHDRGQNSGLQSFVRSFLAVIEFDAHRRGRPVCLQELTWYSACLGQAVTDAIQYFIGNRHSYPTAGNQYLAATAAHITHMLRDFVEDATEGYINIPGEYLAMHSISPQDVDSPPFRAWVQERVKKARAYFREGKGYIDGLDVLRCKIAAHWYCARFEGLLDTIERDGFILRARYNTRGKLSAWLKMGLLGISVTMRHITSRERRNSGAGLRELERIPPAGKPWPQYREDDGESAGWSAGAT